MVVGVINTLPPLLNDWLGVFSIETQREQKRGGKASAVRASGPTARPAHASPHLIDANLDAALSGVFLLG